MFCRVEDGRNALGWASPFPRNDLKKIFLPHFTVTLREKSEPKFEIRVLVTKKIRRAVDRNRVKRVVREFFRQKRGLLPGNLVICRVDPKAPKLKNAELFQELNQVLSDFSFSNSGK